MEPNISKNIEPYVNNERESWKEMTQKIYSDVSALMSKEGQLIRTELGEKVDEVKSASASLIGGGVVLFVGILGFAATAIIMLDLITELWLASMIVTIVFLLVGGFMLASGKKKLEADKLKPNKSIDALGEIGHTLKEKVYEITKH